MGFIFVYFCLVRRFFVSGSSSERLDFLPGGPPSKGVLFLSFGFLLGFLIFPIAMLMTLFKRPRLDCAPVSVGM